jgi:hypothetical protein
MIIAFDLDGTLANIEHRLHFINGSKKDWPAFFRACVDDIPNERLIAACRAMDAANHVVDIWSGRSDMVADQTINWLEKHGVPYRYLRMRRDGDYRPDDAVKAEWLEALPEDERPVLAFDDRQRVVDMWRAHGIQCCQVAPGDF